MKIEQDIQKEYPRLHKLGVISAITCGADTMEKVSKLAHLCADDLEKLERERKRFTK